MYELINTSVPNGLIAGTHGFATVAMTKGMPDAIRTRVESFCAYPHRTSAHDQSYFRDNPVNWFHLQIPSGDHVVGRTAPSEFDYTGRTNRLAHTLVFSAKEMPVVGGAYVLGVESRRFVAEWSGEPKYLAVDKTTAGRLGLADVPRNASPTNWISVFGENGAKYARRFAALVAKNVSGGNKSVYFKTSTAWDSDGTRLLGLFADLINLLPESVRPFVTFSTFAACVPNGVACHLRGVYDKDRAFEIASTTQSWVDCEHGRIVHEELLPEESFAGTIAMGLGSNVEKRTHASIDASLGRKWSEDSLQRIGVSNAPSSSGSGSRKALLIGLVLALLVAAVIMMAVILRGRNADEKTDEGLIDVPTADQIRALDSKSKNQPIQNETWPLTNISFKVHTTTADTNSPEVKPVQLLHTGDKNKTDDSDNIAEALTEDAKRKQNEDLDTKEKEIGEFPKNITKVLNEWNVDDDIGKQFEKEKLDKAILTNDNGIVVWWWDGVKVVKGQCSYVGSPKRRLGKQVGTEYKLKTPAFGQSPWVIFKVPGRWDSEKKVFPEERVYWQWRDVMQGERRIFNQGDSVDLVQICFGGKNDAYKLWREKYCKVLCGITWRRNSILFWDKEVLTKSAFAKDLKNIEEDIKKEEDKKKDEEAKKRECEKPIVNIKNDYVAITNKFYSIASGRPKKISNKDEKEAENLRVKKLKREIRELVIKYPDICKENQYQDASVQIYISRILDACKGCTCGHDGKIIAASERIRILTAERDEFYKNIGARSYKIEVYEDYPSGKTHGINRINGGGGAE